MASELRIGTSGWHYPSGKGTWNGVFYPKPRPAGFDELSFYAEQFNFVEINTTFYGQPRAEVAARWAARTPPDFQFAAKLYQRFTHPGMFRARIEQTLKRHLDTNDIPESAIDALVQANQADIDAFKAGIEPLANAAKLGPLLAQFPASFKDTVDARLHLSALLRAFHGYGVAVELRHRSWSDRLDQTRALLEAFGAAWAWIDEPKFKDSLQLPDVDIGPFTYLRLHGRNARQWWNPAHRDDRYNYEYSVEELTPVANRLRRARLRSLPQYTALNNHPGARSVKNARQLRALVEQDVPDAPVQQPVS